MNQKIRNVPLAVLILSVIFIPVSMAYAGPGCKDLPGESGLFPNETIYSGGYDRSYMLYVPPKYKSNRPTPLVFNIHGWGGTAEGQYGYSNMVKLAEKFKFILVTPQGLGLSWNAGGCCGWACAYGV